jgi:hypothetical protein
MKKLFTTIIFIAVNILEAQSPILISNEGKYLGDLNDNPCDPSSVSNPYGIYGSPYSPDLVNNPFGLNGSEFSIDSPNNDYSIGKAPRIYSSDGDYLGRLSKNETDLDSVSNTYGLYGSPYSPFSINNPYGEYGSPYSQKSATFMNGAPFFKEQNEKDVEDTPAEPELTSSSHKEGEGIFDEYLSGPREHLQRERKTTEGLKRMRDEIKRDIRNKEREKEGKEPLDKLVYYNKEALDKVVYDIKEHMVELYKNGLIEELKYYNVDENTYLGLSLEQRFIIERYILKRILNIQKVLLSEF